MRVIICSGIPGSGKNTWIAKNHPEAKVVSADDYFYLDDGSYQFDAAKLPAAHGLCIRKFIDQVTFGDNLFGEVCIVNNCNLTSEEIAPYYAIAKAYGFEVELVTLVCSAKTGAERNSHGVTFSACEKMVCTLSYRQYPSFWEMKCSIIHTDS